MIKKNEHTCRWRVDYSLAYDGGGSEWTQYYKTKLGALLSKFWHVHIASWGGGAMLTEVVD